MCWPLTSARSAASSSGLANPGKGGSGQSSSPRSADMSSWSVDGARTKGPLARAASAAHSGATTIAPDSMHRTWGSTPGTARSRPSSPSSAKKAMSANASAGNCSSATSTPMAMARSSPGPSLRIPEGAKLTVMRPGGHLTALESRAARPVAAFGKQMADEHGECG